MVATADRAAVAAAVLIRLPTATEEEIGRCVDSAEAYFCEGTGRRSVPPRAQLLWQDLAFAIYKHGTVAEQEISAVKRGDTTINYSGASGTALLDARVLRFRVGVAR